MDYEDNDLQRGMSRVPNYARKTISHSAPEFLNHEQDVIRQSFSTGNHTWMKEAIPVELGPDAVNLLRRQRMERNRLAEPLPQTRSKMMQLWGGGVYQEFEYIPDEHERRAMFEKQARQESLEKREKISNHDWRYASQERRLKHEPMVHDPRNKETFPYLGGDKDTELVLSKPWLRSGELLSKPYEWSQEQIHGPSEISFLAGRGNGLGDDSRGSRMTLPTIVERLQRRVNKDWEGTTVVVSATDQDMIQVAFHMQTVDSERGVHAYMNVLSKDVDLLGNLGLRKVSQLWGYRRNFAQEAASDKKEEDSERSSQASSDLESVWMFFLLMPKWVKMRPTDAFYTVQPRSQGSGFRLSAAGSSVMYSLGPSMINDNSSQEPRRAAPHSARERGNAARGPGGAGRYDINQIEREAKSYLPSISEARGGGP